MTILDQFTKEELTSMIKLLSLEVTQDLFRGLYKCPPGWLDSSNCDIPDDLYELSKFVRKRVAEINKE